MPVTDTDFQELKTRVGRLEKTSVQNTETITWLAGTMGQVKAVQDNHTERLDRIENRLDRVEVRLDRVEKSLSDFREAMPSIVADAMRDVLKEKR